MWLTLNRNCNFRCKWCYADGAGFNSSMSLDMAKELLLLASKRGINEPVLIGGEPTVHKNIREIIAYANEIDSVPCIVTNGYRFSCQDFCDKMAELDFTVSLSLKGYSEDDYYTNTGVRALGKIKQAVKNLATMGKNGTISITITKGNIDHLIEMTSTAINAGAESIDFNLCATTFSANGDISGEHMVDPYELAKKIMLYYDVLFAITKGKMTIHLSQPLCLYPKDFINRMKNDGTFMTGCHVFDRSGVIFDEKGNLLICNCLYLKNIGEYGVNYTAETFNEYWKTKEVVEVNERLITYPTEKCSECSEYSECGGGCPLLWFNYEPKEYIKGERQCLN
jgi:radical SAM protein with 4Fe4S-binding SPASM domain